MLNIAGRERAMRIAVGIALISWAVMSQSAVAGLGWFGLAPLITGMIGWCPVLAAHRSTARDRSSRPT